MKSRMDKYFQTERSNKSRASKNKELYKSIYENGDYSNIEGFTEIKKNENIDLEKIKKLIEEDEKKVVVKVPVIEEVVIEEKDYNINNVLEKAKEEQVVKSTAYDITKNKELNNQVNDIDIEVLMENLKEENLDLLDELKTDHKLEKVDNEMDESFYSKNLKFDASDFDDGEKKSKFMLVLLIFSIILLITSATILILWYMGIIF